VRKPSGVFLLVLVAALAVGMILVPALASASKEGGQGSGKDCPSSSPGGQNDPASRAPNCGHKAEPAPPTENNDCSQTLPIPTEVPVLIHLEGHPMDSPSALHACVGAGDVSDISMDCPNDADVPVGNAVGIRGSAGNDGVIVCVHIPPAS
jgi:hypothetical protein